MPYHSDLNMVHLDRYRYLELLAEAQKKKSEELQGQIDMDVLRTLPEGHEVLFGNPDIKAVCLYSRLSSLFSLKHEGTLPSSSHLGSSPPNNRILPRA